MVQVDDYETPRKRSFGSTNAQDYYLTDILVHSDNEILAGEEIRLQHNIVSKYEQYLLLTCYDVATFINFISRNNIMLLVCLGLYANYLL